MNIFLENQDGKKSFDISLHFAILYLAFYYEFYKQFVLIFVIFLVAFFLITDIMEFIQYKPVVKISEKDIWIKDFGIINRDKISEVKLDFRFGYRLPWIYFSLNFYQKNPKKVICNLPINTLENTKKLREILNAEVE